VQRAFPLDQPVASKIEEGAQLAERSSDSGNRAGSGAPVNHPGPSDRDEKHAGHDLGQPKRVIVTHHCGHQDKRADECNGNDYEIDDGPWRRARGER
jgi:hypothetical protein